MFCAVTKIFPWKRDACAKPRYPGASIQIGHEAPCRLVYQETDGAKFLSVSVLCDCQQSRSDLTHSLYIWPGAPRMGVRVLPCMYNQLKTCTITRFVDVKFVKNSER